MATMDVPITEKGGHEGPLSVSLVRLCVYTARFLPAA
jgi:hypothetical protein